MLLSGDWKKPLALNGESDNKCWTATCESEMIQIHCDHPFLCDFTTVVNFVSLHLLSL